MDKPKIKFIVLTYVLLLTLILSGCNTAEQGLKPSQDWSRSIFLGNSVVGSMGLHASEDGQRVHIVWPMDTGGRTSLHYLQLDQTATVIAERDLDVAPDSLRTPRLLSAGEGTFHLFWASRPAGGGDWELWYALVRDDGELVTDPVILSQEGTNVGSYSVSPDGAGGVLAAWDDRSVGGAFILRINSEGRRIAPVVEISEEGEAPSVRIDVQNRVHLVWFEGLGLRYAHSGLESFDFTDTIRIAEVDIGTGDSLTGPVLGLSYDWVYVIWSILSQSGLESGTARTFYTSFPIGDPRAQATIRMSVLPEETPPYQGYQGFYNFSQIVKAPPDLLRSDFIYQPVTVYQQQPQLALALVVNQEYRADNLDQIAVTVFEDGQYLGYVMAGKTQGLSTDPILVGDSTGNLHLAWREGTAGRKVYYATTLPSAAARLDQVKPGDVINALLAGSVEGLATIMLFPVVGLGWMLPGLLLVGVWKLFRDDENLTMWVSKIFLLLALIVYQGIKLITIPTMLVYVPFSAWIEIPAAWAGVLRISTPIFILGVGLLVAEWYRRGEDTPSTIRYYIAVAAVDGLMTLGIYGVTFLGVT